MDRGTFLQALPWLCPRGESWPPASRRNSPRLLLQDCYCCWHRGTGERLERLCYFAAEGQEDATQLRFDLAVVEPVIARATGETEASGSSTEDEAVIMAGRQVSRMPRVRHCRLP
jgi:hypothetical protein